MMEFFQGSFHLLAYIALVELFISQLRWTPVNYVIPSFQPRSRQSFSFSDHVRIMRGAILRYR